MCRAVCRAPPCSPVPPQKHFLSTSETPFSSYSAFVIQKASLSFMMSASTEPPKKTMCLRRGGSSIRNLSFADCSGWRDRANQRHSEAIRGAVRGTARGGEWASTHLLLVALAHEVTVELPDLLLEARGQPGVHGRAAREDNVLVQVGPCAHVARLDAIEDELREALALDVDHRRLEERLGRLEALRAHLEDATIRKGEGLDDGRRLEREFLLEREVIPHIAHLWRWRWWW